MKKLSLVLAAIVVVLGIGASYLFSGLNGYVKDIIETEGSAATHTKVTLDAVNISLKDASGDLSYLEIHNPAGFSNNVAIKFDVINLTLNKTALSEKGPIVISKLIVDQPTINYEVDAAGKNNIQALSRSADAHEDTVEKKQSSSGGPKVIIEKLEIREGLLTISHSMLDKKLQTKMPMIELRNIGLDQDGVNASELIEQILAVVATKAVKTSGIELMKELGPMQALKSGGLGELEGKFKDVLGGK
jgi:uncharacterized protein involved in outer membrane biogenesis